jgi:hypothetical protein
MLDIGVEGVGVGAGEPVRWKDERFPQEF